MSDSASDHRGAIVFSERLLELLDEGRYTTTYKFALMLVLIDLVLESTEVSGSPPLLLTTRQIAEKTIEIYWPHAVPFAGRSEPGILRPGASGQADIVSCRRFSDSGTVRFATPRRHAGSRASRPRTPWRR